MELAHALRKDFDPRLLELSEGRKALTRHDPLLFAAVYFIDHLKDPNSGATTLCDFHLDLLQWASCWTRKGIIPPKNDRACFIAPRNSGKSTWVFLLLPMWAGAHGHKKFVAAFSDSETQAISHLHTFKQELETNELLREDFPEFCEPMRRGESGRTTLFNRNQIQQTNGFVFMAKGADSAALGMKIGSQRPDALLFDDIEPGESNYSPYEAAKRKETLLSDLFPLNSWATVAIVGTTTMPNSLIDQIRKVGEQERDYDADPAFFRESLDPELRWVVDENIKVHYWPVILDENGDEKSLWPERFPMESLNQDRHTRSFAKNMMNRPVSLEGGYWQEEQIDIDLPESFGNTAMFIDPAVTTAKKSDYTGIAVLSRGSDGKVYVRHAEQVKKASEDLREHVYGVAEKYDVGIIIVEHNQGGDLWKQVFHDMPCRVRLQRAGLEKKEVRASQAFDHYVKGYVKHTQRFPVLEEQMLAFPKVAHDDVLDAVVTGVRYFKNNAGRRVTVQQLNYLEA